MNTNRENITMGNVEEKVLNPKKGGIRLFMNLLSYLVVVAVMVGGIVIAAEEINIALGVVMIIASVILLIGVIIYSCGFKVINPNEALVLTFFGKYYGTIKKDGFYWVNPFTTGFNPIATAELEQLVAVAASAASENGKTVQKPVSSSVGKKISTKTQTLRNEKQKVNDVLGNPIIIGSVVIWKVAEPTKAVFNVENYQEYLSIQTDSVIRNIARMYPYDDMDDDGGEKTLRGSSQEIADSMKKELQEKVAEAGLEIKEVRITNLAYSDEIAAAMLQRQQAVAIIAARQKIVEGAVSMVKMAIDQLGEEEIVVLDEERKAAMVSNLLVVLCGNKDAQPIVNSGSIY